IVQWDWDLGNGTQTMGTSVIGNYSQHGSYPVQLIVTSSDGCTDTSTQSVNIWPQPVAAFSTDSGCTQRILAITEQSSIPSGSITSWKWDFGNGTGSSSQHVAPVYNSDGTYNIS